MARKRLYRPEVLTPVADRVWRYLAHLQAQRGRKFVRQDYCELVRGVERLFGAPRPTVGHVAESLLLLARKRRIFAKGDGYYGGDRKMIYVLAFPPEENLDVLDEKGPGEPNPAAGAGCEPGAGEDDHHPSGAEPRDPGGVAGGVPDLADVAPGPETILAGTGAASGYAELCG